MTTTAVQTTVDNAPGIAAAGMLYDSSSYKDVISVRALEDIPFGAYVCIEDGGAELPDETGDVTGCDGGIALHSQEYATEAGYKAGDVINVLRAGRVWVLAETAMTADLNVFVRYTANAPAVPGGIRNDDDTSKAVAKPGAYVYRTTSGAGLAVLQLNGRVGS